MNETTKQIGIAGEQFFELDCIKKGIPFQKIPKKQELETGEDYYYGPAGESDDIKNTAYLHICRIDFLLGKIIVRHPYKVGSKATHFWRCDVKPGKIEEGKFLEHISILKYCERDFVRNYATFKSFMISIDGKAWTDFGKTKSQASYFFKINHLSKLCGGGEKAVSYTCYDKNDMEIKDPTKEQWESDVIHVDFKLVKVPFLQPLDLENIIGNAQKNLTNGNNTIVQEEIIKIKM